MRTSRCLRGVHIFAVFLLVEAGCTLEIYEQTQEICGNARIDPGEVCDDGNTISGDGCSADCKSNETCGNALVDVAMGEVCDDGNTISGDGCSSTCLLECGNGLVDPGEVCDDGNTVGGDGCSANCKSFETCGNRIADVEIGEVCDDGNTVDGDGCSANCMSNETCGNGIVDRAIGEQCDDGPRNGTNGDPCKINCMLGP